MAGAYASICAWILGYPDRALRLAMKRMRTPAGAVTPSTSDLHWRLGAHWFDHRWAHDDLLKRAEECERLGRENSLPVLWAMMAPMSYGQALIREGKVAEGIAPLKAGIAAWEATGGKPATRP